MEFGVVGCGCDGVDTGWASLSLYPQLGQNVAPSATCAPHFGQKLIDFWLYLFQCIAVTVAVGVGGYHNKVNDGPDSATAERYKHQYTCNYVSGIESVNAQ